MKADPDDGFDSRCNASLSCPVEGHIREIGLGAEGVRRIHVTRNQPVADPVYSSDEAVEAAFVDRIAKAAYPLDWVTQPERARQQVQPIIAVVRAEAVADAVRDVESRYPLVRQTATEPGEDWAKGVVWMLDRLLAGGSVPAATPEPTCQANHFPHGPACAPVATPPAEPGDELQPDPQPVDLKRLAQIRNVRADDDRAPSQPVTCDHSWATGPHEYTWSDRIDRGEPPLHCPGPFPGPVKENNDGRTS